MKSACHAEAEEAAEEEMEAVGTFSCFSAFLEGLLSKLFGGRRGILAADEVLADEVLGAERKLKKIVTVLQKSGDISESEKDIVQDEFGVVNDSLNKMLSALQ